MHMYKTSEEDHRNLLNMYNIYIDSVETKNIEIENDWV